jgi:hypothetical protein
MGRTIISVRSKKKKKNLVPVVVNVVIKDGKGNVRAVRVGQFNLHNC